MVVFITLISHADFTIVMAGRFMWYMANYKPANARVFPCFCFCPALFCLFAFFPDPSLV